jgi:hypothetical protein
MSKPRQLIDHAGRLLDLRGDVVGAEAALREAIRLSKSEGDLVTQAQASAFLGELLVETARLDDSLVLFQDVLRLAGDFGGDTASVDNEVRIARDHLAKAAGLE